MEVAYCKGFARLRAQRMWMTLEEMVGCDRCWFGCGVSEIGKQCVSDGDGRRHDSTFR